MKTWGIMKGEIKTECNIEGEDFISDAELLVFANDGKDQAEAEIISLYDKYLETDGYLALASGEQEIDPPSDIYANKITAIWYNNGTENYEIKFIKRKEDIYNTGSNDCYKYSIKNSTADGIKIILHPASRETSTENVVIHYIRESAAIEDDDSVMDIPLADNFIKQHIKDKVKEKEIGPMNTQGESPAAAKERQLLIEALNQMIPSDSADEMEINDSFYDDFDNFGGY